VDRVTAEQLAIVELPVEARAIVVAGPGTGKTYTLVRRVAELTTAHRLAAGNELLVLTFTNAVVDELRLRLGDHRDAAYVRPSTIDSFAGRIVARATGEAPHGGFDATVASATAFVLDAPEAADIARFRHVIVDEVQDLVGVRLEFVKAILEVVSGGFTLFGDPAQAIYGFQNGRGPAVDAVSYLSDAFPDATTYSLTENHRVRNAGVDVASTHRRALVATLAPDSRDRLVRRLLDCDHVSLDQVAILLRRADARTGVLCRTNGEVLVLSHELHRRDVKHQIRRASEAEAPARWIAETLRDATGEELSRRAFERLAEGQSEEWVGRAWRVLRRIAPGGRAEVGLGTLRERIARAAQEPELPDRPILSTIHRSKGLEYDRTVVLAPDTRTGEQQPEEARVLFVALTRSRDATLVLDRPEMPGRLALRADRWALLTWRKSGLLRVELRSGDVDTFAPPGGDEQAAPTQRYLRDRVRPGDPVDLARAEDADERFEILHDGRVIGRTSVELSAGLRRFGSLPLAIEDVRVDCLRSAAGDPARTTNLGIGSAGFWLAPELVGFGRPVWKDVSDG
jgi:hypothetical protein